ncbi:carboxypeptidase 4 [Aspergillus ambiguus]|uniref:putative serine carboxypeptidase (CpdS) n=1 Tax=Aspergillus ambiguus TaxID=176160 RepID=UPI003CCCE81D
MLIILPLLVLLSSQSGVCLQNPHRKAVRSIQRGLPTRANTATGISGYQYLNDKTKRFLVNGTTIPEVDFDVGESYAGLLPNTPAGNSSLFFWFFPSQNPKAKDEITIWLNGGPGCSSLEGMLHGNGPFIWRPGTYKPIPNPYSWINLTNMVYVDQPAGTGFSPGPPTVINEQDVAQQFNSWLKNFVDTFSLHGRRIYMTGESYAGQFIPYIASDMLDRKDTRYFDLRGIQINDPMINEESIMIYAPAISHFNHFQNILALNHTFAQNISRRAEKCGYNRFLDEALTYPPPSNFPTPPDPNNDDCAIRDEIVQAAYFVNPCFNLYHLTDFCPYLWDEMGSHSPAVGPDNYFNRSDVQQILHVPRTDFSECTTNEIFPDGDPSPPSALGPLPSVIERTNNTIIAHGWLDSLLFVNGSLVTIQNMTWNGAQGFHYQPTEPLYVPYHYGLAELAHNSAPIPFTLDAGAGHLGTAHTERGLTFTTVYVAGHQIPRYAPGAAYRQLEFLLGRIHSLSNVGNYTV